MLEVAINTNKFNPLWEMVVHKKMYIKNNAKMNLSTKLYENYNCSHYYQRIIILERYQWDSQMALNSG